MNNINRGMAQAIVQEMLSRRGLKVALLTAAIFVLVLIPFKQFVILEGITEIRPANAVPVVMAILFGPGAALGAGVGNLIGDILGGTLTWGSIGGFIGNFAFALLSWMVWNDLASSRRDRFDLRSAGHFMIAATVASVGCALIIAVGLELFGLAPFVWIFGVIALNGIVWSWSLGLAVTWLLYGRVEERFVP